MKEKIIKIIEIQSKIEELKRNDNEKQQVIKSNPYAVNEGYKSRNMEEIERLEEELEKIDLV
jgi:hypothetical protein